MPTLDSTDLQRIAQAVAAAVFGAGGTSATPGASAVYNRAKTLPYFCAARRQRVSMLGIGDSNENENGGGWDDGIQFALAAAGGLWSTGLLAWNGGANGNGAGYLCENAGFGVVPGTGAPPALDAYAPFTLGLPAYAYVASGASPSPLALFLFQGWAPGVEGNLRCHYTYGVNPGWAGTVQLGARFDGDGPEAYNPVAASDPGHSTAGAAALLDAYMDIAAGAAGPGDSTIQIGFGSAGNVAGGAVGPCLLTLGQIENRDLTTGYAFQTFVSYGGVGTKVVLQQLRAYGPTARREYLRQCVRLAGPDKLLAVRISEGLNDRNDATASWVPSAPGATTGAFTGPAGSTQAGYQANTQGVLDLLISDWAALGYPAASLFFILCVSHPQSSPDDAQLSSYRAAADAVSDAYANTCSVHLDGLTSYAELVAKGWYLDGPPSPHLALAGYEGLGTREVAALSPTGPEVGVDAILRGLAAANPNTPAAGSAAATLAKFRFTALGNAKAAPVVDDAPGTVIAPLPIGTLLTVIGGTGAYNLTHSGGAGLGGAAITLNGVAVGTDRFLIEDAGNNPVAQAFVQIFAAADATFSVPLATTVTAADGRWIGPLRVNSGSYSLLVIGAGDIPQPVTGLVVP